MGYVGLPVVGYVILRLLCGSVGVLVKRILSKKKFPSPSSYLYGSIHIWGQIPSFWHFRFSVCKVAQASQVEVLISNPYDVMAVLDQDNLTPVF